MGFHEGHYWLDAIEWNFVTLSAVGYGNTVPATHFGKLFCIFYIIFGYVLMIALAVIIFDNCMKKMEGKKQTKIDNSDSKVELTGLLTQ